MKSIFQHVTHQLLNFSMILILETGMRRPQAALQEQKVPFLACPFHHQASSSSLTWAKLILWLSFCKCLQTDNVCLLSHAPGQSKQQEAEPTWQPQAGVKLGPGLC